MNNALPKWIAGLAVAVSQTALAVPITDTVIVGSQEWAQVDLFTGEVSWNSLNTKCPEGVCRSDSVANGYDLAGWTWASTAAVQDLFNAYTGQSTTAPGTFSEVGSSWAGKFLDDFRPVWAGDTYEFTQGVSSDLILTFNRPLTHSPYVRDVVAPTERDWASTLHYDSLAESGQFLGAWFVRQAPTNGVPVPATLTLFGLGLASMWIHRRKKHANKL